MQFLSRRGPKHTKKNFQVNRKKKNFRDCSKIKTADRITITSMNIQNINLFKISSFSVKKKTDFIAKGEYTIATTHCACLQIFQLNKKLYNMQMRGDMERIPLNDSLY